MPQGVQNNRALEMNMDVNEKYISDIQAFYIKNREFASSINKGSLGKSKTITANEAIADLEFPYGENYKNELHRSF